METTTEYKADNKYLIRIIGQLVLRSLLTWVFIVLLGQCIGPIWKVNDVPASPRTNFWINFSFSVVMCSVGFFLSYKKTLDDFRKLGIKLGDESITKIKGWTSLQFQFSEITQVTKAYSGTLSIYSSTRNIQMIVPYYTANYNQLEEILKNNTPLFKAGPYTIFEKYYNLFFIAYLALYLTMLAVTSKIAMVSIAIVLIGTLLFFCFRSYKVYKSTGVKVAKPFYITMIILVTIIVASAIRRWTLL